MYDDIGHFPPTLRKDLPLDDAHIRSAVRLGKLLALRRGVFAGRIAWDEADDRGRHLLLAQAAILATSGEPASACLGSAAIAHGFARLGQPARRIRLYRAKGGPWRDDQVAVLTCGLPPAHVTDMDGLSVTTGARTVVDLARWVSFRGGVVIADSALRKGVARREMEQVTRDCVRWPGIRKAREVIKFADERAASPLESVSRVAFHELGLPAPELQVTLVWDDYGNPKFIVDFFWEDFGVIGEADGLLKYDDEERLSLRAEKLRQEELEAMGFIVVRWTWDDIWRRPEWVATRIRAAFAQASRRRRTAS